MVKFWLEFVSCNLAPNVVTLKKYATSDQALLQAAVRTSGAAPPSLTTTVSATNKA